MKNFIKAQYKAIVVLSLVFAFSLFGFSNAFGYGGSAPSSGPSSVSAPTSTVVNSINYPMSVSPSQEGTQTSNLGEGTTLNLQVPAGAVSGATTFETKMETVSNNQAPANTSGAFMLENKVFNISATDANNQAVRSFNGNLTISIVVPDMPADTSGLGVYWFSETAEEWVLVPGAVFDPATGKVVFSVNHLTIFSIILGNGLPVIGLSKSPVVYDYGTKTEEVVVLGLEHYEDGTLIRGKDMKIYVIQNGEKYHIKTLKELYKYSGEPIFDVDDETLSAYPEVQVLGLEGYGDGALIRGNDKKVYVIKNGKKEHIINLVELRKYAGQKINDVAESVLAQY